MRRKYIRNIDVSYQERIAILQQYQQQYQTIRAAASAMGISSPQATWLNKLAGAPKEVQSAVDGFDQTKKRNYRHRTDEVMAFSAWREMAHLPGWVQVVQLKSGRVQLPEVKADAKVWEYMLGCNLVNEFGEVI